MKTVKKYLAELIGTFALVTLGCGTACAVGTASALGSGYLLTALAFGLALAAMSVPLGAVSGCHLNPAVSLAMWIAGKLDLRDFLGYLIAQFTGSALACVVLGALFGFDCGYGANAIQSGWERGNVGTALLAEFLLTFFFVLTVMGVAAKTEHAAAGGLAAGLSLTVVHVLGIALTGTSVNPARSLLPAVFAGGAPLREVWIFVLAPLAGGAAAALCAKLLFCRGEQKEA